MELVSGCVVKHSRVGDLFHTSAQRITHVLFGECPWGLWRERTVTL